VLQGGGGTLVDGSSWGCFLQLQGRKREVRHPGIEEWVDGDGAHQRRGSTTVAASNLSVPSALQWLELDKWQSKAEGEAAVTQVGLVSHGMEKG
jgi:hypothetical protein